VGAYLAEQVASNRPVSPPPEWWLLLDLAFAADDRTGRVSPGFRWMTERTRAPRGTLYRWLRKLRIAGLLETVEPCAGGQGGAGKYAVYQIQAAQWPSVSLMPPDVPEVAQAPESDVTPHLRLASTPTAAPGEAVPTALYRYYDADDLLLYVGITGNLYRRQTRHERASSWMDFVARSTVERFPDREAAETAETAAIKAEGPLFNDVHNATPEARQRLVEYLIKHDRLSLLAPAVSRG